MAEIDKEAALEELEKATRLKARAEELVEIAAELQEEAERHEHDAQDLIAPDKMPTVPSGRLRPPSNPRA